MIRLILFKAIVFFTVFPCAARSGTFASSLYNTPADSALVKEKPGQPKIPVSAEAHRQLYSFSGLSSTRFAEDNAPGRESLSEFTPEYLNKVLHTDKSTDSIIAVAQEVFNEINKHKRFLDILAGREVMNFPVGIRKRFSQNSILTVGVVNARFHGAYAEVDLFARLELSELNADLFFAAANVKLSHKGGIYEQAKLHLVSDFPIVQEGGQWLLTFMGGFRKNGAPTEESFMVIDCEGGIQELSLAADIRISKNIAVPLKRNGDYAYPDQLEPSDGKPPVGNESYVGAQFKVQTNATNNFIFNLSLPHFELKALKGWGFRFNDCTLDLSDTQNISGLRFPASYNDSGFLIRGQRELWRGFYAADIEVMLPREFRLADSKERIVIGATDFIIDNHGVSGDFFAENVISLDKGTAGGWRFSVDKINAEITANIFTGAGFSGSILLPLSGKKKGDALQYEAFISPYNEYLLDIGIDKEIDFSVFKARARLFKGSYVRMEVMDERFYPEAHLTGVMSFNPEQQVAVDTLTSKDIMKNGLEKLDLQGLQFQNLRLQTKAPPFLEVDYLALRDTVSSPKFFGFQLGVHDVYLDTPDDHTAVLGLNAYVNLDETGIKGDVGLRITAALNNGDLMDWKFDKFQTDSVGVSVRRKNFELDGSLYFSDEHKLYGDALSGRVRLYSETMQLEIGARAIFGYKDGYNYWYADAYGKPSGNGHQNFKIYSLSGGLYHHMKKSGYDRNGANPSGILYEPDSQTELGFKAMAAFEVKQKLTFSGLVGIEMSFNNAQQGGGVRRVGFYGAASLMNTLTSSEQASHTLGDLQEVQQQQSRREDQLSEFHQLSIDRQGIRYFATEVFPDLLSGKELFAAQVAMDYDLTNGVYWGLFDAFLNLGGIRGDGEKNRLGYIEFYSAPDDWYVYVGTPERRFGVRDIPVGPFKARANVYYMTGTQLPPPAQPPANIADLLNLQGDQLELNRSYSQQLANGKGYAFGASFALGTGFDWGLVYANVEAGVGFDLMMKNFGDSSCRGNGEQIGMNGWYANGQAYAYLQGEIGVRVDVFFMKMDVPVLHGGIALLAQAQLPNPWFIKGYAGLELNILGNIRIKTRLKVIIGEPCEITEKHELEGIDLISDIAPFDGASEVNVFETVNIALNVNEGEMLRIETLSGKKYYKALLDTLEVYQERKKLSGKIIWNDNRNLITWEGEDILPEHTELMVWVKFKFYEYIDGVWQPLFKDGVQIGEERKFTFTTGAAPTAIPYANIASMFPVVSQKFVLAGEFDKGYIQLKKGQDYLFEEGLENHLVFIQDNGNSREVVLTYDKTNNRLRFDIPELQQGVTYTFKWTAGTGNKAVSMGASAFESKGNNLFVTSNKIRSSAKSNAEFTRLAYDFTTSKYSTFKAKIRAMNVTANSLFIDGDHDVAGFVINTADAEPWDIHDIAPARYNEGKPFIRPSAHMTDGYFKEEIHPLLYNDYPLEGNVQFVRDTTAYGFIPVRAVLPSTAYAVLARSDSVHPLLREQFPFQWRLARTYKQDFIDLQQQLVTRYLNNEPVNTAMFEKYKYLINGVFPYVNTEKYKVYFSYILPYRTTGNRVRVDYQNTF